MHRVDRIHGLAVPLRARGSERRTRLPRSRRPRPGAGRWAQAKRTLLEAISTTKVVNILSSAIATVLFAMRGVVDFRLGLLLGAVMVVGGSIGADLTTRIDGVWLRRIFVAAALALAVRTLLESLPISLLR